MKTIIVKAQMDYLKNVMEMVEDFLEFPECSDKTRNLVCVSVEEIFANISSYAYAPGEGEIEISCSTHNVEDKKCIDVRFKDRGIPFDPTKQKKPDFQIPFEKRKIGGLGIHMVMEFMDDVSYQHKDGYNILVLRKML